MVKYDSSIIQTLVHQLYSKANFIVIFDAVIGLILGSFIGYGTLAVYRSAGGVGLVIGAIIGLLIGNEIGLSKALLYKFQAQMLLTQVEIENNTHRLIEISATTSDMIEVVQDMCDTYKENTAHENSLRWLASFFEGFWKSDSHCYKIKMSIRDLDHLGRREQKLNLQGL